MHRVLYLKHQAVGSWHQPEASLSLPPSAAGIHLFKAVPALRGMCRSVVDVGRFLTSSSWALARLLRYRCCILSVSEPSVVRTMTQPLPSRPMTSPSMPVSCCACRFPVHATTTLHDAAHAPESQKLASTLIASQVLLHCSMQAGSAAPLAGVLSGLVYLSPILNSFPLVRGVCAVALLHAPRPPPVAAVSEGRDDMCLHHACRGLAPFMISQTHNKAQQHENFITKGWGQHPH